MKNLEEYLVLIEEEIDKGKPVRFSNRVAIDKDYIFDILVDIRSNIPEEINQARKIIEDHDKIIEDAKAKAEKIIQETEKEARNMINEHEVYKKAAEKADAYLEEAKKTSENWSLQSVEYVDSLLEEAGNTIEATIEKIEKNQKEAIEYFNQLNKTIYENRGRLRE